MTRKLESSVKLTYADYCAIPDDLLRHEIIDGEHFVTPAPELYHQRIGLRLASLLGTLVNDAGLGEAFISPVDVLLSETDVVQPDIVVVLDATREILTPKNIQGPPDLVIEILSPSTRAHDRRRKKALYERAGVPEYWIVDPKERIVEQHVLHDARYELTGQHDAEISWAGPGLLIDLRPIW